MLIKSEKDSYRDEFREITSTRNEDIFLWGEELLDKEIILYDGKIKELPKYATFSDCLINCGLIVINLQKGKVLKCVTTRMNPENNKIYLQEDTFNAVWSHLRKSIDLGIRLVKQTEGQCTIEKPENILNFAYLIRKTSSPVLENNRIIYRPCELSEEVKRLMGARQSAMDNRKNLYFYSKDGVCVHDRSCELLKKVPDKSFVAATELPEDRTICRNCARTLYIRMGCRSNNKEVPILNHIFSQYGVKTSQLQKIAENGVLEFHAKTLERMTVIGEEDTWEIVLSNKGNLQLWHNNYVKTSPTERYITEGFHNQGIEKAPLPVLLRYIEGYSWQKHLQAENIKKDRQIDILNAAEEQKINDSNETIKKVAESEINTSILFKLVQWLKKILHIN